MGGAEGWWGVKCTTHMNICLFGVLWIIHGDTFPSILHVCVVKFELFNVQISACFKLLMLDCYIEYVTYAAVI